MSEIIAGILLFRKKPNLQLLLAHPGGPLAKEEDEGSWTIPRHYVEEDHQPLETAQQKFKESFGFIPDSSYLDLSSVILENDEKMRVWAVKHDIPDTFIFEPFWFEMEWPPDSGQVETFPEMDRIKYFGPFEARKKIETEQTDFITRLISGL